MGNQLSASRAWQWAARAAPFLVAVLLMLSFVSFSTAPPDNEVDASLSGVLDYAHCHGIQFGRDLVFTYGPLGFLTFFYYSPHALGPSMAADVSFCLLTATGLCLLAWRLRPLWRWTLLLLFFWIAPNVWTRADLVMDIGLLCWGLMCFVASGPVLPLYALAFTALAAFAALAKVSFLLIALGSVALVGCDLALRGHWRMALGVVGGWLAGFVSGWTASGQALANLGAFFANSIAVAQAYNGALGWEDPFLLQSIALVLGPAVLGMIVVRALGMTARGPEWPAAGRGLLLAWLTLLSFAVWKHSCVRAGREMYFLGFIVVLALGLEALPCERVAVRRWARGLALGICAVSLVTVQVFCFVGWPASVGVPFHTFSRNLACLLNPGAYELQLEEARETLRQGAQLPRCSAAIRAGSVDVFGQSQASALYNGWHYCPRPVFQSYVACSRRLMQLNERFYLSAAPPEHVLFELRALDRKFPPLEDALVLRTLLANYRPVGIEGRFILLQRAAARPVKVSLLRQGTIRPGQVLDLRQFRDSDLWVELTLEPTWLGRLRQVLLRPPTVRLAAWGEPGGKLLVRNRAPAQMLAAGFLASPLLLNNEDVLNLYTGQAVRRPGACGVELLPGEGRYWQDAIQYRIYQVESRLGRCMPTNSPTANWKR